MLSLDHSSNAFTLVHTTQFCLVTLCHSSHVRSTVHVRYHVRRHVRKRLMKKPELRGEQIQVFYKIQNMRAKKKKKAPVCVFVRRGFTAEKENRTITENCNGFHYNPIPLQTLQNIQLLTIKTIKKMVLGHIPLGFSGFNKPPIEGDQLPVETHRVHYSFH